MIWVASIFVLSGLGFAIIAFKAPFGEEIPGEGFVLDPEDEQGRDAA